MASKKRNYKSVKQMVADHAWLTNGHLRAQLLHRESNGLNPAVTKLGGKILIDEDDYFAWIEDQSGGQK